MSNHETHRHIFTILLGLSMTTACAAPSEPEGAVGPDAAPAADAVAATVGYGASPIATPALRAAHIAARQAEGASDRRYQVIAEGAGLRTERHRGLAARFDVAGVILRTDDGREGRLDAGAVRCGGRALTAPRGPLTVDPAAANRIVRGASAGAREWYVNGPLGLEHGFDLDPAGCAATLTVDLATPGFVPTRVGDDVRLVAADGSVALRYGDLFAHDAVGQALPARFVVGPQQVTIAVDVVGARGLVTIDPLVYVEIQRVGPAGDASDTAAGDGFGGSVAMAGTTAVVGAPGDDVDGRVDQGSAYVYVRDGHRWSLQARLIAADGDAGDGFGTDVAVDGDTVVVTAPGDDNGAVLDQGAAYVYVRSGTAWSPQARLVAFDGAADDGFGYRVALAGNTALVSARGDDVGARVDQGGVYFYARNGVAWSLQLKVNVPDGQAGDELGSSVALSSDTAVIGAAGDDGAAVDQGSAYVYIRSGGGWAQQVKLLAGDPAAQDRFGVSVALSGNTALIGSYLDNGAFPDQGSAYVFVRNVASWQQRQKLVAADGAGDDHFGVRVAVLGDLALIGSSVDDVAANVDQGSAYVFVRNGVGGPFVPDAKLVSSDGATGDQFGYSVVAIAEAGAVYYTAVGAPFADGAPPTGGVDEGAVYFGHLDRPGVCSGQPAGTVCRAAAAPCDAVEVCDGVDSTCPPDGLEPVGTACGDGSDSACDHPDSCNAAGGCEANYEAATTICRADSGACDVAETCDGAGACPVDGFEPAGTACDPVGETCAASAETCTGGSATCPADDPTPCAPPPVPPIRWVSNPSPTIVGKCVHASRLHLFERPIAVNRFGFPLPVTCAPISGVGVHDDVVCTAHDFTGHTATTTITVTVLARLRVAFQAPILDDNRRDNVHTDHDIVNLFKVGSTVAHRVKLYACDGRDVTQALMPSVSVKLHVTERNQFSDHLVVDVPENYVGTGGPGGLMVPSGGVFEYDLRTNGYEANTSNNGRYFRSLVKVSYNTHPTITVGREDARLESKR